MNEIKALHRQAMARTDDALLVRQRDGADAALPLFREAYQLERQAAMLLADDQAAEPNRSILLRSAATLALDSRYPDEAERLACYALAGTPPPSIAEELRDLLEQIHFERHLALRGVELLSDEIQLSLSGRAIGYGMAPTDLIVDTIDKAQKLLRRTTERMINLPFREAGRPRKGIQESVGLFMSVPRAASFAVTFRIGQPEQLSLPDIASGSKVVAEVMNCLELFASKEIGRLRRQIADKAYFQNFIILANAMTPNGHEISQVGFTATIDGKERSTALISQRNQQIIDLETAPPDGSKKTVEVIGVLKAADARSKNNIIRLVGEDGKNYIIVVPEGTMADIVRPLWDSNVRVVGVQCKKSINLQHIEPAEYRDTGAQNLLK